MSDIGFEPWETSRLSGRGRLSFAQDPFLVRVDEINEAL